jgi:hypothetical protein
MIVFLMPFAAVAENINSNMEDIQSATTNSGSITTNANNYPDTNLVGHWKFDESQGSIAEDSSGNGRNGAIHGCVRTMGMFGNALDFTGDSNRVTLGGTWNDYAPDDFSIVMWAKVNQNKSFNYLFHAHDDRPGMVLGEDNNLWFKFKASSNGEPLYGENGGFYTESLPLQEWFHVAMTWDGSVLKGYVNGQLSGEKTLPFFTPGSAVKIGSDGATVRSFDGLIDDVKVYKSTLSDEDILLMVDGDQDSLPDGWEVTHGLDLENGSDALEDTDQDGVLNFEEYLNGSDPSSKDYFTSGGEIRYFGNNTGQLYIAAYADEDIDFVEPVGEQVHDWPAGIVRKVFSLNIPNGRYKLKAFLDIDVDGQADPNEPQGIYDEETIMIDHSDDVTPRNFTLKADPDSTDGLVAWYPFDEGFDDQSGENRHPEPVGAPELAAGPCGERNVLRVSEGNYLRVPAERRFIPGDGSFTISVDFYIQSEADIANSRLLTLQRGDFSDGAALWARIREKGYPHVRLMMDDLEGERSFQNLYSGPIEIQKWMNVAAVVDRERNTTSLYLDGVKVDEAELQMGSIDPTKDMLIGAYDYGDRIVSGNILMDDLRIYDRPLSDEEIATLSEICPPVASESIVSIEPSQDTVKPGRSFRTKILVEGEDLWAAQIRLKADPGKLELIDQGDYGHLMPKFRRFEIDIDADPFSGTWSAALSLKHPSDPLTGEGVFARGIKFQALDNVYGEVDISGEAVLTDRFGDALPVTVVGGTITIDDGIHGGDNIIQGTVTYPDGTPAIGVDVTISIGGNEYTVQTDENGHYTFEDLNDLAEGQAYQIEATNGDFYDQTTVDTFEDGPVTVPLVILNTKLADLNKDGVVDIADFTLLADSFGLSKGESGYDARADIKPDNTINIQDLALLGSHWQI